MGLFSKKASTFAKNSISGSLSAERIRDRNALQKLTVPGNSNDNFVRLSGEYAWQDNAVEVMAKNRFSRLIAPTGSGKTEIIKAVAYQRAFQLGKKSLIIVPQQHIAEDFKDIKIIRADGTRYERHIHNDFRGVFRGNTTDEKVKARLKNWLRSSSKGSIAITTTSAFTGVFNDLPEKDWAQAFNNLWIALDEGHHIAAVRGEDENEALDYSISNRLGEVCEELIKVADMAVISATHFRGDGVPMFFDKAKKQFEAGTYERSFQDHWKWLNLRAFHYNCIGYDLDATDILVEAILADKEEYHLVCVPPNHSFWVKNLQKRLAEHGVEGLDLVDQNTQDKNKDLMIKENKNYKKTGKSLYRVLFSCNLMREGTDFVAISRIHDLAPSAKANRTVQTIGRATRKDARKIDIEYNAYFKNLEKHADKSRIRDYVADRTNNAIASMIVADDLFREEKFNFLEDKKQTLREATEETFGKESESIQQKFLVELNELKMKGNFSDDRAKEAAKNTAAQTALAGWKGDKVAGIRILREYGYRIVRFDISPNTISERKNPSEIRENGFDITERRHDGFALFGSEFEEKELADLHKIVGSLKNQAADMTARMLEKRTSSKPDLKAQRRINQLKKKGNKTRAERAVSPSGSEN